MPIQPFAAMPDDARLWSFAAARPLTGEEAVRLLAHVDDFLAAWHAHGHPVAGAREWRHGRFLLVAADERATGVSGCSIDSLFHTLREAEQELGTTLADAGLVWFREGEAGEIRSLPRPEFRVLARQGAVGPETVVFDLTAGTVGELRAGRWEVPARESWHARAFGLGARAVA